MKEAAIKWLRQAEHDLEIAEKNIGIGGYDIAAFLSHQAVEKPLKALIISQGSNTPKTHYLDMLAQTLGLTEVIPYLNELSADYMISRYPDVTDAVPYEEYTQEIAAERVAVARKIFSLLESYSREIRDKQ